MRITQNIFFNAILYYFLIKQCNVYADLFTNKTKFVISCYILYNFFKLLNYLEAKEYESAFLDLITFSNL